MRLATIAAILTALSTSLPAAGQCRTRKFVPPHGGFVGCSVGISDGRAIVGAWQAGDSGEAHVLDVLTGDELFTVQPTDAMWNDFGISVSIHGTLAVVGADLDSDLGDYAGAAYVYDVTSGQELVKLYASDAAPDGAFGAGVAVWNGIAVIGAPYHDDGAGKAYVFDLATYDELFRINPDEALPGDHFGFGCTLRGTTAIIGATGQGGDEGAAYVYDVQTGTQIRKLTPSDGQPGDWFGRTAAFHGDLALVGAPRHEELGENTGAAYLFDLTTGQELFKFTGSPEDFWFGFSVAMEGSLGLVGTLDSVYTIDLDSRTVTGRFTEPKGSFGYSVALDGRSVAVGAPHAAQPDDPFHGEAYLYSLPGVLGAIYCEPANANSTGQPATISAVGQEFLVCEDIELSAADLPPGRYGYFLTSPTQDFVPFPGDSQGNLCLGGVIDRFASQVQESGPDGAFSIAVDVAALPVQPGDTLNFQAWFRDANPGPTSNFTDAVAVTFW